jgi:hypothetical protein
LQRDYVIAVKESKEFQIPIWFWPTHISPLAGDLLVKLLQTDPTQRITATEALRHPWCRVGLSSPEDDLPGSRCLTSPTLQDALHNNMHLELGETGVPLSTAMSIIANEQIPDQDPNGTISTTAGNGNNICNYNGNSGYQTPTTSVNRQLFSEAGGVPSSGPGSSVPVTSLLSASLANVQPNHGAYVNHSATSGTVYDNSHSSAGPKLRHLKQPSAQVHHISGKTNQPEKQQQQPAALQQPSQSGGWQYDREAILQQQRQKEAEALALYQLQQQQAQAQQQSHVQRLQQPPQSPYVQYQQENSQIAISPHVPFQSSPLLFIQQQQQHTGHGHASFLLAHPAPGGNLAQYSVSSSFGSSPLAGSPPFLYPSQAQLVMNRSEYAFTNNNGSTMVIAAPAASMMVDESGVQSSRGFVPNQPALHHQHQYAHNSNMMTMEVDAPYEAITSSVYPPQNSALNDGSGSVNVSSVGMSHGSVSAAFPATSMPSTQYLHSKESLHLLR